MYGFSLLLLLAGCFLVIVDIVDLRCNDNGELWIMGSGGLYKASAFLHELLCPEWSGKGRNLLFGKETWERLREDE